MYELFRSFLDIGETDFIKSKELVEECKKDDGSIYRLFETKFNSNKMIDNYYKFYKQQKKSENKK